MTPLMQLDALTLSARIRCREVSAQSVVRAMFEAIELHNPTLLAYCTLDVEAALRTAIDVDDRIATGGPVGALAGIPVSVKDLIFTRGVRTTGGCAAYADFIPDQDDIAVERLRAADAVILGKTNVAELGYSLTGDNPLFGTTRNPWDRARTSGGSSAGAAAAVASGMGPIALGSDGGGSIRVPASFCGLYGFKPSMGRVPLYPGCRDERFPGLAGWESLEHIGPLTRTVRDAALAMSVIAGPDPRDRHSIPCTDVDWLAAPDRSIAGRRIAYCPAWGDVAVDAEIAATTRRAAEVFTTQLGCTIDEVTPQWGNPVLSFRTLIALETDLAGMRRLVEQHGARMSPHIVRLVGNAWTAEAFTTAMNTRKAVTNAMHRLMTRYDFVLTPTSHVLPPLADPAPGAPDVDRPIPLFTCIANMTGQPAASIPAGWSASGLPIGVQLIGRHLADADVLAASAAFERALPWANRWPPL